MQLSLSAAELALLHAFDKHAVRFMIVGLTSAVLQGAHVVTQDIDLWIEDLGDRKFLDAVKSAGGFYIAPGVAGTNPPMLGPGELRVFDLVTHLHGLEAFDQEYRGAEEVKLGNLNLKILPLERIIASKLAANREKDRAVLPALKALLALKQVNNKTK